MATNPLNATPEDDTSYDAYETAQGYPQGSNAGTGTTPIPQSGIAGPGNPSGAILPIGGNAGTTPTASQSGVGNPTGGGNYGPTVSNPYGWSTVNGVITPNATTQRYGATDDAGNPDTASGVETSAYDTAQGNAAQTPEEIEEGISGLYAQEIAGIQSQYNALINTQEGTNAQNSGATRAGAAASGALGSAAGNSDMATETNSGNAAIAALQGEEQGAEGTVEGNEASAALGQYQQAQQTANQQASTFATQLGQNAQTAISQISAMAGTTPYANLDPQTLATMQQQSGLTPQQFQTLYQAATAASQKPGTQIVGDSASGYYALQINPTTGQIVTSSVVIPAQPKVTVVPQGATAIQSGPGQGTVVAQGAPKLQQVSAGGYVVQSGVGTATNSTIPAGSAAPAATAGGGSAAPATPAQIQGTPQSATQDAQSMWNALPSTVRQSLGSLGMTPTSLYYSAWSWLANGGTVSTTGGMGGAGQVSRQAITSAGSALAQSLGLSPQDVQAIGATGSGLTSSLDQQIGLQQQVAQFEGTAQSNLKVLQTAIANNPTTAVPLLNQALQAWQNNIAPSGSLASLQTALQTFSGEYAKIMSGSTSGTGATVSSINDVQSMLNSAMASNQLAGTLSIMSQDMQNRSGALTQSVANITSQIANLVQQYQSGNGSATGNASSSSQTGTINVGGQSYTIGSTVEDNQGNQYVINADGSLTPINQGQ